jgi:hypothetical protein
MKKISIVFFILFVVSVIAQAEEISVVDVKRNITMADDDIVYKDFAINAGTSSGLKRNLVVFAKRKFAVKDSSAKSIGEIETNVAQLKVIYADSKMAIAREYKIISRDEEPVIEQSGVMTGDRIDLAGSFIDSKPLIYKKKPREPSSVTVTVKNDVIPAAPTGEKSPAKDNSTPAPVLKIAPNPAPLPEI